MPILEHERVVARTPDELYDFVTTPSTWLQWHPSVVRVTPPLDVPAREEATFTTEVRTPVGTGINAWTVGRCVPGREWHAQADMSIGGTTMLTYRIAPHRDGALFTRTLEYRLRSPLLRVADRIVGRRRIDEESRESLDRLATLHASHDPATPRRVAVLGRGGAGKSSLARRIGSLRGIDVIELDAWFWRLGPRL
ncbi:SRPBCC family protein [Tsukamurella sp. 8F]|uniref:SRPBCC family protein n=1 Tax=unclassified Tsukamurella TaxID=2633480 RepID=UPI0023BA1C78|nr:MULTISPECIES: SRPBCC family protein [unclassified Tsukamurella]MDF0528845.1 SRPBCC family protein [Tsukamurella sp. 8J]MDF0586680.1 SRPBCC family protein [Tsukamurella sp. 8F]